MSVADTLSVAWLTLLGAIFVGGFILFIILKVRRAALTITTVMQWDRQLRAARDLRDQLDLQVRALNEDVPRVAATRDGGRAARDHAKGLNHFRKGLQALEEAESWGSSRRGRLRLAKALEELRSARHDFLAASAALERALAPATAAAAAAVPFREGAGPRPGFRECCFFCSRPLSPDRRLVGHLHLARQSREVIVCEAHAADLEAGRLPMIRAVDRAGVATPWFAIPDYDPYRDYLAARSLRLMPSELEGDSLQGALDLSYVPLQRPSRWYSDDTWDDDYRTMYWGRHDRWEQAQGPERVASPPETRLALGSAPETPFGDAPTAAETAFAGVRPARSGGEPDSGRVEMDFAGGPDQS